MSIEVPTELFTAASGSVGDLVFSHNQHGPYTRARTVPTDPATPLQVSVRAHLSACCLAWNSTLTQSEREAWDRYSLAVRLPGRLARRNHAGGIATYIRSNVPRLQAAEPTLSRVDEAPAFYDLAPHTPLSRVVLNVIDDTFHPCFSQSDPWATERGAAMLFYASAPQPLTRNFWKGPYQYAGPLLGSSPRNTTPGTLDLPAPAALGQRVFTAYRVTRADGRLSALCRLPADTDPQVAPLYVSAQFSYPIPGQYLVDVYFDGPIRRQSHASGSWLFRFANYLYYPWRVITLDNHIQLRSHAGNYNAGPNLVRYIAAPSDVFGLLTGIDVDPFIQPF